MPDNYSGPISTKDPSGFPLATTYAGKFFTFAGAERMPYDALLGVLDGRYDGSETKLTGSAVESGTGTIANPYVINEKTEVVHSSNMPTGAGVVNTLYVVRDKGDGEPGIFYYDGSAYVNAAGSLSGGGGTGTTTSFKSFTPDGAVIGVSYFGATDPTVTGSAGSYTITFAAGTEPRSIYLKSSGGTANLTLTVTGDRTFNAALQFTDLSDGARFLPGQRSVTATEVEGASQVANNIVGIGGATSTGYAVKLTF